MKKNFVISAVCGLVCAASLCGCGDDIVTDSSSTAETTAAVTTVAETTADAEETTTAETAETTTAAETTAAETGAAETTAPETTAAEESKTDAAAQTTEAPAAQDTQATDAPATKPADDPTPTPDLTANIFDTLKLGSDPASFVAQNKNYDRTEADSCLVNGKDVVYTYPEFELHTTLENGKESVVELYVTGTSIRTPKGIGVGSTKDEVIQAYGESESPFNVSYTVDGGTLKFMFDDNDKVKAIDLMANV